MVSEEHKPELKSPMFVLDGLYCEEEHFEEEYSFEGASENVNVKTTPPLVFFSELDDFFWEDDEIVSLISKEKETHLGNQIDLESDGSIRRGFARREVVEWILRVNAHFGFTALTTVLAVNYFDRFISSFCFQRDKPWMTQLAAVACLSLSAKVEETQVPLLLDLQVEDSKYVFEAKIIQRMELLVLSSLQWKMHPVTPLSFFDHITRRLGLKTHLHFEFLRSCERLLLSLIVDARFASYLPSVLATATMSYVIKELDPCNALDYQNQLMGVLKMSKDKLDGCYKLIQEVSAKYGYKPLQTHKRKYSSIPGSPNGVIDAYFSSCDSSNESWAVAPSVSSSPEPLFKKSRAQDQQMRLAPLNRFTVGVFGSPL